MTYNDDQTKVIKIVTELNLAEINLFRNTVHLYTGTNVIDNGSRIGANLTNFPLTNLDDMREDILAAIKENTAFTINKNTIAPYGLNFRETKKLVTKEGEIKPIERDCITSYYPMQGIDRKSTRLNSSHSAKSRMPSSA